MKTFHEVIDEIYYKVDHLEPWERGTRKTAGMSKFFSSSYIFITVVIPIFSFCLIQKISVIHLAQTTILFNSGWTLVFLSDIYMIY